MMNGTSFNRKPQINQPAKGKEENVQCLFQIPKIKPVLEFIGVSPSKAPWICISSKYWS